MSGDAPDLESVTEATRMVWTSVVGDAEALRPDNELAAGPRVSGIVHISGGWEGSVQVSTSRNAAVRVTAALYGMDESAVGFDEIIDALGELTNMVGGTIKSTLPGPSKLSLPSVTAGGDYEMSVPGARRVTDIRLAWANEPLRVTVWAA